MSVPAIDVSQDPVARALRGFGQWPGVQQGVVFGAIFATILVRTGDVWMLMVAHVAFDLTALAIIYLGLEAAVAQLFFA